jgi:hypothetical protein
VTIYDGIDKLPQEIDRISIAEFVKPYLGRPEMRIPYTIMASQLVGKHVQNDMMFLEYFENACDGSKSTIHCMHGLGRIINRWAAFPDSIEDIDSHVMRILRILNSFVTHADETICQQSLITIRYVLGLPKSFEILYYMITPILGQLRRVVDHIHAHVRAEVFSLISTIFAAVGESDLIDSEETDESVVTEYFRAASDLWIPCVVRTQDTSLDVRKNSIHAFHAILSNAICDDPVVFDLSVDPLERYTDVLDLVRRKIGECSHLNLNASCFYLLGLSSVSDEVMVAASRLVPVILELIPEPSNEAMNSIADIINKLLASSLKDMHEIIADILVGAKRIQGEIDRPIASSS